MKLVGFVSLVVLAVAHCPARAEPLPPSPFTTTLSNHTPLVFGMSAEDTAAALGQPLTYVSGRPGNEIYLVVRNVSGSFWTFRDDPLYLQFRGGRLTGWKADWSRNWMWQ
ncbi:MAG TPA: hypothetical protein VF467_17150 [Afipia sp.]